MQPDPTNLINKIDLSTPIIGFYDAPDTAPFEPLTQSEPGKRACVFDFYRPWIQGKTLHITRDNHGCGGAGHWVFGIENRSRQGFIEFLVDDEGLKSSHELMGQWLDHSQPYQPQHPNILIGPLRPDQYAHLKTITFYANPDQLGVLMLGAQYHNAPGDPPAVIAPFGSGCMQLVSLFASLEVPQAIIGATDIAMRRALPPDALAFTVTKALFKQLCELDEKSFLYKPFWQNLRKARGLAD